jgi:hypothetical protein
MGFLDVNGVEGDLAIVGGGKFVESGNLPPEGRSGVAAEDEYNRLLAAE